MRVTILALIGLLIISAAWAGFENGCGLNFCNGAAVGPSAPPPSCGGTIDLSAGCTLPMLGGL